ncbi:hypothetical protein ACH5RR_039516 [Cinchona calisaya]|uniref:Uncharacterized protein n=1 Tax=Cinchona calisaya TaxID=153742 RepID=A0ABD2XZU0_9GENT
MYSVTNKGNETKVSEQQHKVARHDANENENEKEASVNLAKRFEERMDPLVNWANVMYECDEEDLKTTVVDDLAEQRDKALLCLCVATKIAHDIPTGNGNTLPERMIHQELAFSQLMDWPADLPAGYVLMTDLLEIKAISAVLREHMRTVDATLDSLRQDLSANVNGIDVLAMVDTRATHSFVTGWEVRRLKLKLKEHGYRIKVINSEAQAVLGVASVDLTLGPWSGKCTLMAVPLDDLKLGKEFMAMNKIFPIPHLDGVMIADESRAWQIEFLGVGWLHVHLGKVCAKRGPCA